MSKRVFWASGVRRKVPGVIHNEILDAEVSEKGIKFFPRNSFKAICFIDWRDVFLHSHPMISYEKNERD